MTGEAQDYGVVQASLHCSFQNLGCHHTSKPSSLWSELHRTATSQGCDDTGPMLNDNPTKEHEPAVKDHETLERRTIEHQPCQQERSARTSSSMSPTKSTMEPRVQ